MAVVSTGWWCGIINHDVGSTSWTQLNQYSCECAYSLCVAASAVRVSVSDGGVAVRQSNFSSTRMRETNACGVFRCRVHFVDSARTHNACCELFSHNAANNPVGLSTLVDTMTHRSSAIRLEVAG